MAIKPFQIIIDEIDHGTLIDEIQNRKLDEINNSFLSFESEVIADIINDISASIKKEFILLKWDKSLYS